MGLDHLDELDGVGGGVKNDGGHDGSRGDGGSFWRVSSVNVVVICRR